jgi:glucosamine-6-phosphate deaminase
LGRMGHARDYPWFSRKNQVRIEVHADNARMGQAAAAAAGEIIAAAVESKGSARIVVGTGPSQNTVIDALVHLPSLDWSRVEVFHLDEYVGISPDHPASFRRWLKERVADVVHPAGVHYLNGDAADADAECRRYAGLLAAAAVDVMFLGFGENGHIAFNDPGVADFTDPLLVRRVRLDDSCRAQQVGEGHFATLEAVPAEALTITCTGIMRSRHLVCSVPERRKAEAVRGAIEGPLSTLCPASLAMTHPHARLFLDRDSASLVEPSL